MAGLEQQARDWWAKLVGWLRGGQRADAGRKARAALEDIRTSDTGRKAEAALRDLREGETARDALRDLRDSDAGRKAKAAIRDLRDSPGISDKSGWGPVTTPRGRAGRSGLVRRLSGG